MALASLNMVNLIIFEVFFKNWFVLSFNWVKNEGFVSSKS